LEEDIELKKEREEEEKNKKKSKTKWQQDIQEGKQVDEARIKKEMAEEEMRQNQLANNISIEEGDDELDDKLKDLSKSAAKKDGLIFDIIAPQLSYVQIDKFDEKLEVLNERIEILKWQQYYKKLDNMEIINEYEIKASEVKSKLANVISDVKAVQPENVMEENVTNLIVVFKTIESAQKFSDLFSSKNCCVRMWYWIFCHKHKIKKLYLDGEWLSVEYSPDEPNEILWDGLGYPSCKKCCANSCFFFSGFLISLIGK